MNSTFADYYEPVVLSATDYYPFGMEMPGRTLASGGYRFGFNGKEKDTDGEWGTQTHYDYGFRIYEPGIGRFLSVDPLMKEYPMLTPYQFASNTPIAAIDFDGLESSISITKDVWFVELKNVDFEMVYRKSNQLFISAVVNISTFEDFGINTQVYDRHSSFYTCYSASSPQPISDYIPQGFNVVEGEIVAGRSSPGIFYFSESSLDCSWSCGAGDVPSDSHFGFGGGIPLIVNGLKYGAKNKYSSEAPKGLPEVGFPGTENEKYLLQRSSSGFVAQNSKSKSTGKTILGYNSSNDTWIIVSQQNGAKGGMSYEKIRDVLYDKGYDNVLGFDGSTSSTLTQDGNQLVSPNVRKNSTIPSGLILSVPEE